MIEESYPASSGVLEWVIDLFYDQDKRSANDIYAEINQMVESVAPDNRGLIFLPYLHGQRNNINARAAWIGLLPCHTRAHILQAVYEGVAFTHMRHLENLFCNRPRPKTIHMAGGATNSSVWVQIFADVIGIPLEVIQNEEIGAKGAAIVAAVSVGIYPDVKSAMEHMTSARKIVQPRPEIHEIYQEKYQKFKSIVDKTDDIWPVFQ
jgi:L-xylulokinase